MIVRVQSHDREIEITVIGRKSGRAISLPVWFVLEEAKLYLLPVHGSETQWYRNVLKNPSIRIGTRGTEEQITVVPIVDGAAVSAIVERFRAKYGAGDIRKYYSKLDVAVLAHLERSGRVPGR